jgi:hypothetical protein
MDLKETAITYSELLVAASSHRSAWALKEGTKIYAEAYFVFDPATVDFTDAHYSPELDILRCKPCGVIFTLCSHFPLRKPTAIEWQAAYAERERMKVLQERAQVRLGDVTDEQVEEAFRRAREKRREPATPPSEEQPTLNKKPSKRKTKVKVTKNIAKDCVNRYNEGEKLIALAKEYNVKPTYLSAALKNAGAVIKRGRPKLNK